jgi:hypothetical protein
MQWQPISHKKSLLARVYVYLAHRQLLRIHALNNKSNKQTKPLHNNIVNDKPSRKEKTGIDIDFTPYFIIVNDTDVSPTALLFCSKLHASRWAESENINFDDAGFQQASRGKNGCCHCYWCGRLAAIPSNYCFLHENDCPGFVFNRTSLAAELTRTWYLATQMPVDDTTLHALRRISRAFPDLTAQEIVERVTNK